MKRRANLLLAGLAVVAGLILNFDSLLLRLGSHLPGTDEQAALSLLGVWWPAFKLTRPDGLVVHSYLGAPYLINHLLNSPMLPSAAFTLLRPLVGPVAGFNLLLVAAQIATHLALFAFIARKYAPPPWAVLASTAFILSPWYSSAVARADLITASLWTLPLGLLAWEAWLERPSTGRAVWVALALYAAVLAGVQNNLWIAAVCLPYVLLTGRAVRGQPDRREQLSLAALLFLVLLLLYPLADMVRALQGNEPAYAPMLGEPERRSVLGWALRAGPAILLAGAATLLRAKPDRRFVFWSVVAGYALVAAAGVLPDPYYMLLAGLGVPYRPLAAADYMSGVALFALLMLGLHAWRAALAQTPTPLRWQGIGAGLLLVSLGANPAVYRALPQHAVSVPAFYQSIAAEPEDYLLLEVPFGLSSAADGRALGDSAYLAQYAVWHEKRPMSGVAPYIEPLVFDQARAMPFLFPREAESDDPQAAAEALAVVVREGRIGYVIAHPDLLDSDDLDALRDLAGRSGALCPPVERDGLIVYRALWHPAGCNAP